MPKIFTNLIALPVLSILISLAAAEFLAKFYCHPQTKHQELFVEYDPILGWKKIANMEGVYITSEYQVTEQINSAGFRGSEYNLENTSGAFRILILGDSFAEGYTVNFEYLFSEVLRQSLEKSEEGIEIEVINTGTAGYSTDQELIMFMEQGKKYTPNLTVLHPFCPRHPTYTNDSTY